MYSKWTNVIIPYKGRVLDEYEEVRVYRNLNKKGVWYSIVQNGKTVAHTTSLSLFACHFYVNKAARLRIIAKRKKEFHAYVEGYCTENSVNFIGRTRLYKIKYNPYINEDFIAYKNKNTPVIVKNAWIVLLNNEGVKASQINQ